MYEDLVKHLRNRTNGSYEEKCEGCEYTEDFPPCVHCTIKAFNDAADAIEDLIAALTASNEVIAKNKPRWIPVTERLPEMGKEVLVSDKQKKVTIAWIVGCFSKDGASFEWACSDGWIDDQLPITHWQPLPEPPKEET